MTVDGNSGDDGSSTSQSAEAVNFSMRLSQNLAINEEDEAPGASTSKPTQSSPPTQPQAADGACALQNGGPEPHSADVQKNNSDLSSSCGGGRGEPQNQGQKYDRSGGGGLHNFRQTLSRWLKVQRPKAECKSGGSETTTEVVPKMPKQRLVGWPPRWTSRSVSRSNENKQQQDGLNPCTHRALPPVPPPTSTAHDTNNQGLVEPDNLDDRALERVRTPEMRPEDFPPGVAYLPEGDDDEPSFKPSSDGIIDFAASLETVKNVRLVC